MNRSKFREQEAFSGEDEKSKSYQVGMQGSFGSQVSEEREPLELAVFALERAGVLQVNIFGPESILFPRLGWMSRGSLFFEYFVEPHEACLEEIEKIFR